MANAVISHATVLPGNRVAVEVEVPEMEVGRRVQVILVQEEARERPKTTVADLLTTWAPGHRLFQSAAEIDRYLEEERNSWDE